MLSEMDKQILHNTIKNIAVEIALCLRTTSRVTEQWLHSCCNIFHEVYLNNGQVVLAFLVKVEVNSPIVCSLQIVQNMINNHVEAAEIDLELNIKFECELPSADQIEIAQHGSEHKSVIIRIDGEILEVYIKGLYKKRINLVYPLSQSEKRVGKSQRSHKDYKILIDDHSKKRLINLMGEYWADREKRLLIPGITEAYFQKSLYDWLDRCLSDAFPKMETPTRAGDRTDIDIYVYREGIHYVIEIKWLGKNQNNKEYKLDRVVEGLGQIATYFERDFSLTEVYLVCYDGRSEEEHITNSKIDKNLVPPKGDYKLIFLESESASRKGEKYANRSKLES